MRAFPFSFISFTILLFASLGVAQQMPESLMKVAELQDWVEAEAFPGKTKLSNDEVSDGKFVENIEVQWHIPSQTRFYRSVVQIIGEAGLENNGEWTFTFDPEFQTQSIHWTRVIRDGMVVSDYNPAALLQHRVRHGEPHAQRKPHCLGHT